MPGLGFKVQQFSRVADFYTGKTVFVTGAAGFVGAVLLETLLRCCPGIRTIYVLIRPKKNVPPEVRKEQIFNKKIFEKLKEETPELLEKIHVIPGDASLPKLGMSEEYEKLLVEEVSVVFHCAAIINFTKPLKSILINNVLSLNGIIELCRRMRNFEVLVYTSTAYSNCNHTGVTLKEEVYRLPFRAEEFLDALKNDNDERLQEMYAQCKPDWPNTYTFSKCLAENVIKDTASDLPIAIIRPSIVVQSWKHPVPGYVEENSGIFSLSLGSLKGFVKVVYADPNKKLNLVPVDIVANAHVLAAWSVGTKRCMSPLIVNCTATEKLHIEISEYHKNISQIAQEFPLPKSFNEYTNVVIVPYRYLYYVIAAYHHYLPAIVLDGTIRILGKKPRIYSLYRFFDTVMSSLNFFMFRTFEFERNNLNYLDTLIHDEDRKDLAVDFKDATFLELARNIPEVCPFYDWKIDRKSPSERKKVIYRRQMIINCIQGAFMMIFCLLTYWIFSSIFL